MTRMFMLSGLVSGALLCGTAGHAATPLGKPGYYATLHYVVSAMVSGSGQCTDAQGTYYTSTIYYPGAGKPGTIDWRPINLPTYLGEFVSTFPTQPAAGVTTWSGKYTVKLEPSGTVTKPTFRVTTTNFDTHSSVAMFTATYPTTAGGTCTVTEQENYTPTGS